MFKIPDRNKERLERNNQLPLSLMVTFQANNHPLYDLIAQSAAMHAVLQSTDSTKKGAVP
jgi:hypothetical protein